MVLVFVVDDCLASLVVRFRLVHQDLIELIPLESLRADIVATVYVGYNSTDGVDSSQVSSAVDWR